MTVGPPRASLLYGILAHAAFFAVASTARADGAYGRLDGDLAPSLEVGASLARGGVAPAALGRVLYLGSAGIQAGWWAPRGERRWSTSLGVEVRPLFLPRFLKNREQGPPRLDLLLDSIHLGLAARLGPGQKPGIDLTLGLEFPLSASFEGFFLGAQAGQSWPHEAFSGSGGSQMFALFSIGFRGVLQAHLVDARDRTLR